MSRQRRPPARTGPLRARRYGRLSTILQGEGTSREDQDTKTAAYVARQGWTDLGFVIDLESGTTAERDHWQETLAEAQAGLIDVVVVSRWDRFARTMLTGLQEVEKLRECDVSVAILSPELVDTTSPGGELVMHIMLAYSHYERRLILERLSLGAHGFARRGGWPSSSRATPMGYRKAGVGSDSHLELHPEEAHTIREAVRLLLDERLPLAEVARVLNASLLFPRGRAIKGGGNEQSWWHADLLAKVLREPARKGEVSWGDPAKRGTGLYGPTEYCTAEPVISAARWDAVQRALALRPGRPAAERRVFPLSGLMTSPCGDQYHGVTHGGVPRYHCRGARWSPAPDYEKCSCSRLPGLITEDRVWSEVVTLLSDRDRLAHLAEEYTGGAAEVDRAAELVLVGRQVATLRQRTAASTADYLRAGADPVALASGMELLQGELAVLLARQQAITLALEQQHQRQESSSTLGDLASRAGHRLATVDLAERKEVLHLLKVRVQVLGPGRTPPLRITGTVVDVANAAEQQESWPGACVLPPFELALA